MGCKALVGISDVCGDLMFPSGMDGTVWIGYKSDLAAPFSLVQSGDITTFQFTAYNGLTKWEGVKFSHNVATAFIKAQGGNTSIQQTATLKFISLSTQDDVQIQKLLQATDAFMIYKDNNSVFKIAFAGNGAIAIAGDINATGTAIDADVSSTVTLQSSEKTLPLIFNVGTETTTLAFLNARVI